MHAHGNTHAGNAVVLSEACEIAKQVTVDVPPHMSKTARAPVGVTVTPLAGGRVQAGTFL